MCILVYHVCLFPVMFGFSFSTIIPTELQVFCKRLAMVFECKVGCSNFLYAPEERRRSEKHCHSPIIERPSTRGIGGGWQAIHNLHIQSLLSLTAQVSPSVEANGFLSSVGLEDCARVISIYKVTMRITQMANDESFDSLFNILDLIPTSPSSATFKTGFGFFSFPLLSSFFSKGTHTNMVRPARKLFLPHHHRPT